MTTVLDKQLKRLITIEDNDFIVAIDPDGIRVTGKGKRIAQVAFRWQDLLNGDAAMAVALNASLVPQSSTKSAGNARRLAKHKA